ncbi:hypothetical protein [Rhodospira trueperi]|uniref:hypothetical protein n=1 Tax=Rhodospira trueperi TaxID=69960 RepID=UPI0015A12533|nr:hypothetical protein [Rhodospira trueperi]
MDRHRRTPAGRPRARAFAIPFDSFKGSGELSGPHRVAEIGALALPLAITNACPTP